MSGLNALKARWLGNLQEEYLGISKAGNCFCQITIAFLGETKHKCCDSLQNTRQRAAASDSAFHLNQETNHATWR
jgi:hypothetical protein